jgi:hypothetical protein
MTDAGHGRGWLRLVVPRDNTSAPFTAEQLFAAVHAGTYRGQATQILLAGDASQVGIWLRVESERLEPIAAMIRATYPDVELDRTPPPLPVHEQLTGRGQAGLAGTRWRLAHEAAYPIKTVRAFEHSEPMAMTLGALAECRPGEHAALSLVLAPAPPGFARRSLVLTQALVTGAHSGPWWQRALALPVELLAGLLEAALGSSSASAGSGPAVPLNADLEARVKWIAGKAAQPAFRVTLHTAWRAAEPARAARGHAGLVSALGQFAVVGQNALPPRRRGPELAWRASLTGTAARG